MQNPNEFVNPETWNEYLDENDGNGNENNFLGYLQANKHLICYIENILDTKKNFEELRDELVKLKDGRQKFIDFAKKHYP